MHSKTILVKMNLSIIIISYNTKEITRNCLSSIYGSNLKLSFEIIVVDNASNDGSPEMVEQEFPEVILIKNTENKMFAKANNQGIKVARGIYILLLNSDTLISEGNVEKLVYFLKNNPSAGCVGPRVLNYNGSIQSEGFPFVTFKLALSTLFGIRHWPIPNGLKNYLLPLGSVSKNKNSVRKVGWLSGCCILTSAKLLELYGGLDENFFFYNEDVEWCYRIWQNEYECWVNPHSEIVHLGGASTTNNINTQYQTEKIPQDIYFYKKTFGIFQLVLVRIIYLFIYSIQYISNNNRNRDNLIANIKYQIGVLKHLSNNILTKLIR